METTPSRGGYSRQAVYVLFAALVALAAVCHLGPALVAGLFSYMVLDVTHRRLLGSVRTRTARSLAVLVLILVSVAVVWILADFLRLTLSRLPEILGTSLPKVVGLGTRYGFQLPFDNVDELRAVVIGAIKDNVRPITKTGGLVTRGFFHVLIGVLVAILHFMTPREELPAPTQYTLYGSLRSEIADGTRAFMRRFERVFGAQFVISSINTVLTAGFMLVLGVPYLGFLTLATFVLGMLPIVGTILSSALIFCAALMISLKIAMVSLAYLVVIHKLQVFIYSHVIGLSTGMPIWQVLLGILLGEAVMGIPGLILAPAILFYAREELRSWKLTPPAAHSGIPEA